MGFGGPIGFCGPIGFGGLEDLGVAASTVESTSSCRVAGLHSGAVARLVEPAAVVTAVEPEVGVADKVVAQPAVDAAGPSSSGPVWGD
jgi:hypothetical protein